MIGVINRLQGVKCEVGTCLFDATHSEYVKVIPDNSSLKHERHVIDIALCQRHDEQFQRDGLIGTITAHGDEIAELVQ